MIIDFEWYEKHHLDISQKEIDELGLQLTVDGKSLPEIHQNDKKGNVKILVSVFESN